MSKPSVQDIQLKVEEAPLDLRSAQEARKNFQDQAAIDLSSPAQKKREPLYGHVETTPEEESRRHSSDPFMHSEETHYPPIELNQPANNNVTSSEPKATATKTPKVKDQELEKKNFQPQENSHK